MLTLALEFVGASRATTQLGVYNSRFPYCPLLNLFFLNSYLLVTKGEQKEIVTHTTTWANQPIHSFLAGCLNP